MKSIQIFKIGCMLAMVPFYPFVLYIDDMIASQYAMEQRLYYYVEIFMYLENIQTT